MRKILLADKDNTLKDAFRLVFPKEEYKILYAKTGKEAIEIGLRENPSIFFINFDLPDMKGIEVLRAIRESKKTKDFRFFFLKDEGFQEDLSEHETDGVIDKPINYLALHELMLEKTLESKEARGLRKGYEDEIVNMLDSAEIERRLYELKNEIYAITEEIVEEAQKKIVEKITPLLRFQIETYVEKKLPEIAQRVLKEKIDRMIEFLKK